MYKREEEQLMKMKQHYDQTAIPEQLDSYIHAGVQRAKKHRKRRFQTVAMGSTAAAIILLLLVSIRVSPAFANYMSQLPGMERIVAVIQGDKGLESAIDHDYIQIVGKSDTDKGITFKVDEMIADDAKIVIFYSISGDHVNPDGILEETQILDERGKEIHAMYSGMAHRDGKGRIDIDFGHEGKLPEQLSIKTRLTGQSNTTFEVNFPVNQAKFANQKETIALNETVIVEGQKLTFKELIIYPTKMALRVHYDEENTKELFAFDDLAIENEAGEAWAVIKNGVSGMEVNDTEELLYLQSNYFIKDGPLYLTFSSIRALDKDKREVVLDLENERLIKRPDDKLELYKIDKINQVAQLEFLVKRTDKFDRNHFYSVFDWQYQDHDGNTYETDGATGSHNGAEAEDMITYFSVENVGDKGPITIRIKDYPTRIKQAVKLKVR